MVRAVVLLVCFGTVVAAADPGHVTVRGRIVDKATAEPLAGVTIVATLSVGVETAISDELGNYSIEIAPATTLLTYYYAETTVERTIAVSPEITAFDLGTFQLEVKPGSDCCACSFGETPPMIDYNTAFTVTFTRRWPTVRARDTSSLAPLVASAGSRVTIFDGGRRITNAPGVAFALLDEADVYSTRGASYLDQRTDGIALASRAGSNENHGEARIAYGNDGTSLEAGAGGPIAVDHAWWWAGAVLGPAGQQELARVDYLPRPDDQGRILAMHQSEPAPLAPAGARVIAGDVRDDWADVSWTSKHDDNKLVLKGGVTGERLDDGDLTTRAGVRASIQQRGKLAGYHDARILGEFGAGKLDVIDHRDASAAAGDNWMIEPSFTVDAGVRWDERWFGTSRAQVWQPHATIGWDWTKEGRSELYVSADRASLLDATTIGGWVNGPRWRDDVSTGVRYEVADGWLVGAAVRDSEISGARRTGLDATLDHRGRWLELRITTSTVDNAVAGFGLVTLDWLAAGVTGRWAAAGDLFGSQAGATALWRKRISKGMSTSVGGEFVTDRQGTLGRAVVGFSY